MPVAAAAPVEMADMRRAGAEALVRSKGAERRKPTDQRTSRSRDPRVIPAEAQYRRRRSAGADGRY